MEHLKLTVYGNPLQQWLVALVVAVAVGVGLRWLRGLTARRLARLAARTSSELDDVVVSLAAGTRPFFVAVLAAAAAAQVLSLPAAVDRAIVVSVGVVVLLQLGLWGNAVIAFAVSRSIHRRLERDAASVTTVAVLSFVAKLALWTVVLLVALDNVGVNITGLVAGLGVGGIAVALALQNALGDLLAAFAIALDRPFAIGDFIVVGDFLGTVEHVGLKTTRVRSLSGEQIVFSNTDLLNSRIRNYKRMEERRVVCTFGVTYDTPLEQLTAIPGIVRQIVEAQTGVRHDRVHFTSYGDFALVFELVYFVLNPDYNLYMDIQQAINVELFRQFHDRGIEFAYPTQTVYVRGALEAAARAGSAS